MLRYKKFCFAVALSLPVFLSGCGGSSGDGDGGGRSFTSSTCLIELLEEFGYGSVDEARADLVPEEVTNAEFEETVNNECPGTFSVGSDNDSSSVGSDNSPSGSIDLNGTWSVTETTVSDNCSDADDVGDVFSYVIAVSHNGDQIISSGVVEFSGSFDGSELRLTVRDNEDEADGTLSYQGGQLVGNVAWRYDGFDETCNGVASLVAECNSGACLDNL